MVAIVITGTGGVDTYTWENVRPANDRGRQEELGKNDFLRLLITQLEHQDPMSPMDNTDFIAQMAQFSSLEQMQNLNDSLTGYLELQRLGQASTLIGRKVELAVEDGDNGDDASKVSGTVEGITFHDGEVRLLLEGATYRLDAIQRITDRVQGPEGGAG